MGNALSNCLASTLDETGMACLLSVVGTNFRLQIERSPLAHIKLRTLWRPIVTPNLRSAKPATAVGTATGRESRPQMNAGGTHCGCSVQRRLTAA